MLLTVLLAAGSLALQTSALGIPLKGSLEAQRSPTLREQKHRAFDLPCHQRTFPGPESNSSLSTYDGEPISIHLELDIANNRGHQSLFVNGVPVYPETTSVAVPKAILPRTSDLSISSPAPIGYALAVQTVRINARRSMNSLQFTILSLGGVNVQVDTVDILMFKSPTVTRMSRVARIPYAQTPGARLCATSTCRLRAIIADRLREMLKTTKACACKVGTWLKKCFCPGRKHGQNVPGQDRQYQRHRHHNAYNRYGRLRHSIRQNFRLFVVPAIQGAIGGMMICALGTFVIRAFVRCRHRCSSRRSGCSLPPSCEVAVKADEKEALVKNGDMPPQYNDVDVSAVAEEK